MHTLSLFSVMLFVLLFCSNCLTLHAFYHLGNGSFQFPGICINLVIAIMYVNRLHLIMMITHHNPSYHDLIEKKKKGEEYNIHISQLYNFPYPNVKNWGSILKISLFLIISAFLFCNAHHTFSHQALHV